MNCIIVDDDIFYCKTLTAFCKRLGLNLKGTYSDPVEALSVLSDSSGIDLVFLDIHMPEITGFDILKSNPKLNVIISTMDGSKAIEAFDYNVVDYLLKPVTLDRFIRAVNRAKERIDRKKAVANQLTAKNKKQESNVKEIFVNVNKKLVKIELDNIYLIEAKGDYVLIKLVAGKNIVVHTTLKSMMDKLPKNQFVRVHRSNVVNIKKIVDIEDSNILINKEVVPVSKTYREELLGKLNLIN
ncbi:MAG: two-component system response regulator LytT [Maribacter sp.]|jgi:two-component system response regulator LytT